VDAAALDGELVRLLNAYLAP